MKRYLLKNHRKISNLQILQHKDLWRKVQRSLMLIDQFICVYGDKVYISFSGGKDSTVLAHLVRQIYPECELVFVDTGLEFDSIRKFVKTFNNVTILKPSMRFDEVIKKYGYPVASKEVSQKISEVRHTRSEKLKNKRLNGDIKGNGKVSKKWQFLINAPFECSNKCCDIMKKNPAKIYTKETGKFPFIGTMTEESKLRQQ